MRANPVAALILLAVWAPAAASELYQAINGLRAGNTGCAVGSPVPPLTPNPRLERAAAALAAGVPLARSVPDAGYRATRTSHISITGEARASEVLAILQRKYCAQLLDSAFTDIGIHHAAAKLSIVLAAPFAPKVAGSAEAVAQQTLTLVNDARAVPRRCGARHYPAAPPLRWNERLAQAARAHAEDMARFSYFSHEGRDGSKPSQRAVRAGYRYRAVGENLAAGPVTAEDAVAGWIKSPGHCANLMSGSYSEMGVAFAINKSSAMGVYWAQVFGSPR